MFDGADFLARSLDWAGRVVTGAVTVERPEIDRGMAGTKRSAAGGVSLTPSRRRLARAVQSARTDRRAKTADRPSAYAAEGRDALPT